MLRFNLSKSGIGVSGGIKGLRIGTGPRGTYVRAGRGGFYYQQYLFREGRAHGSPRGLTPSPPLPQDSSTATMIESAAASTITDSSEDSILGEIRERRSAVSTFRVATILCSIVVLGALVTNPPLALVLFIVSLLALAATYNYDQQRRLAVVMYDLEDDAEVAFRGIYDALMQLRVCGAVWSVVSHEMTRDYKRHAGASALLQRKPAVIADGSIPFAKTNVSIPQLRLHRDTLYFFPDRVFITNADGIGAVSYANLHATSRVGRFIEEGPVPRDARQVDTTWRFLNKNGTPDRRFSNNRQLPILAYQEILFASESGVRAYLQVSASDGADAFLRAMALMQQLRARTSEGNSKGVALPPN